MKAEHRTAKAATPRLPWGAAAFAAAVLTVPVLAVPAVAEMQPAGRVTITPSPRVAALVARMTLTEKLSFVSPAVDPERLGQAGYIPGVPRLGVPELRLTDGPAGVRLPEPATALPIPVSLASAFDERLARRYGKVMAREGRAMGQDVLLSPMVNIIRVPFNGRNYETFSEDPLVTSRTAAGQVRGIQRQGMIATVKHYAAYNQEADRDTVDVQISDQALHEVELPGFAAAIRAGAGAVMCSYNSVNGDHTCSNDRLLNEILKTQLRFRGWVMSDWGATQGASDLVAGLDQNMHWVELLPEPYFASDLRAAIENKLIPVAALDDAVARILGQMERVGLLDGAADDRPELDLGPGAVVAQDVAESGAVLLRNRKHALPLTRHDRSLGLIGPTAKEPKIGGGGSANVVPVSAASPLDTIRDRAGSKVRVEYAPGVPTTPAAIPQELLSPVAPFDPTGSVGVTPAAPVNYSGTLTVPEDGAYSFVLNAPNGYAALTIDGANVATSILTSATGSVQLSAGEHALSLFAFAATGVPTTVSLGWITPVAATQARVDAVALARRVRTPIVFAYDEGTAVADRASLSLPAGQDELISAVAAANPRTIVVLNTGSSVTMPWLSDVRAVLDMYYPGQNGAEATARLLFGDINPSGKLTQTFPRSEDETPFSGNPQAYPGVDGTVVWSEGIDVGYKWYLRTKTKPLFPFGFGRSYTTFDYRSLQVHERHGKVTVQVRLKNTGKRAGAEVVQVYAGPSRAVSVPQPVRQLVGYRKVQLRPGTSRVVTIPIGVRKLSSWDTDSQTWRLGTGRRGIWAGGSSVDLTLRTTLTLSAR